MAAVDLIRAEAPDRAGYGYQSPYVLQFWVPALGTHAGTVLRACGMLTSQLATKRSVVVTSTEDLAHRLHLTPATIQASLTELVNRALLTRPQRGVYGVPPHVREMFPSEAANLPGSLLEAHEAWVTRMDRADAADRASA